MPPNASIYDIIEDPGVLTRDPDWKAKALAEQALPPDRRPSSIPGFTVEEVSFIESFAASMAPYVDSRPPPGKYLHRDRWERWITDGAMTHIHRLPTIQPGRGADICMTVTRLGWAGGYRFRGAEGSEDRGDSHHPHRDASGCFYLISHEAAGREAVHRLYTDREATTFAEKLREHFLDKGHDVADPIPDDMKRRIYDFDRKGLPHV